MKKLVSLILSLALVFSLTACGGQTAQSPAPTQSPAQSDAVEGPVTIENGGRTLTFGEVPQRVVCLNMQMTEMMLMLGLGDKVIYTCYTNAEPMVQIKDAFNAIPLLSEKYPSTEVLLGAEPDLVLGQRFGFTEDKAGTVETLADHGLPAYVSEGTLASEEKIENIYLDIENLGKIFRVEGRAEALIGEMQDKVAAVAEKTAGVEDKITVFVMDSVKENEMYTCAKSMETEVIKLAGGVNVCENDSAEQWFYVSAETLIDKNPDVILFNQYGSTPVEEKIAAITSNPALANVDAVKNRRFMTTVLQDVNESVRVADTVTRFAHSFYPELFEQYPVTITSYNQEGALYDQTFDACPSRVVCNQPQAIQLLLPWVSATRSQAPAGAWGTSMRSIPPPLRPSTSSVTTTVLPRRSCWTRTPTSSSAGAVRSVRAPWAPSPTGTAAAFTPISWTTALPAATIPSLAPWSGSITTLKTSARFSASRIGRRP